MLDYIGLFLEVNSGRFFFSSSLGFVIVRVCTKACVLKGVKIPEGLIVVIPVYSIQRDPSIYPDPDEFDPEHFSPAAKQSINP